MAGALKTISEGILYSSVSRFVIKIFSAIGYFFIINRLSLHDYGIFTLCIASLSPFFTLVVFNFDRIFVSTLAQYRGNQKIASIKGLIFEYFFAMGVVMSVLLCSIYALHIFFPDKVFVQYLAPLSIFFVSQILMNVGSLLLEGHEKFKEISVIESVESISRCVYVLLCALFFHFSVSSVILLYSFGKLTACLVSFRFVFSILNDLKKHVISREKKVLRSLIIKLGKWEIARSLFEQSIQPLRLWIIRIFVNIESVAIFEFARSFFGVVSTFVPMKKILFPIISRFANDKEKGGIIIVKAKKVMYFVYTIFYLVLAAVLPVLLPLFFPGYAGHVWFVLFVFLHLFIDVYKLAQEALIYAYHEQKFLFQITPIFLVVQICVDILCMKIFGVFGVAVSWHLTAFIIGIIINKYLVKKEYLKKIPWKTYFQFDNTDRLIINTVVERLPNKIKQYMKSRFRLNDVVI